MIVLCTGTSGSGQIEYLNEVAKLVDNEQDKPKIYDLGDTMQEIAKELRRPIPEDKLVDVGIVQELLSGWAFERIKLEVLSSPETPVNVVVAHACFRRRHLLFPGFHVACVRQLKPDMVLTIVDDIRNVQDRLSRSKTWAKWCDPRDLSCWREEEILVSSMLACYQEVDYYVIPQAEPPITLFSLLYEPDMKKIYLSFPISNVMRLKDEEKKELYLEGKESLLERLRQHFIAFDPLSIKDLQLIPDDMDESEAQALAAQTVPRDYMLVDQSDLVVVYYPIQERSLGVAAEMRYAKQFGKTVHAVINEGSPFLGEFVDYTHSSPDDLINALLEQMEKGEL